MPNAMLTIRQYLVQAITHLEQADCDTARLDAEVLIGHVLGQDRAWLYSNFNTTLTATQLAEIEPLIQRRTQREPVAYIIGTKEFFGLTFHVEPHVLIPRPETELLIETALTFPKKPNSRLSVVDVGTGSGCIAITLATYLPTATIQAIDLSVAALDVARRNAHRHHVTDQVLFRHGDLLTPLDQSVDLIVSNPPYVSQSELQHEVSPEVARYEPRLALDGGGDDGLRVICRLLEQAKTRLKPSGWLLVEIGASQGQAVQQLAQEQFPQANIELKQDLSRRNRLLVLRRF
ncbi:peptide chain release factor N(5)-glutamine methyltransferase [Anaerolineales bacterium HSG25]|nr:peptide chain release factor N(5)-glutamine methyltransferase [Anaerolineales bacterium HSG25]